MELWRRGGGRGKGELTAWLEGRIHGKGSRRMAVRG